MARSVRKRTDHGEIPHARLDLLLLRSRHGNTMSYHHTTCLDAFTRPNVLMSYQMPGHYLVHQPAHDHYIAFKWIRAVYNYSPRVVYYLAP